MTTARIVLIDNFDSFTYNLVDELRQLGYPLVIYRNNIAVADIIAELDSFAGEQLICLSPGPGHPAESGHLLELIAAVQGRWPILGICLGFQALVHASGGTIDRCSETVHGKPAAITIDCAHPIHQQLTSPLVVARYHSLCAYQLPASVKVIGSTQNIPMAAYFEQFHAIGFQFHPESILTSHGSLLLAQTVQYLFTLCDALHRGQED